MSETTKAGESPAAPFIVAGEDQPRALNVLGERITVLADTTRTGGLELFRQQGNAGQGPPPHAHDWNETFYIVSGEIEFGVGAETRRLGPGALVHVPANVSHWFRFATEGEMISVTSAAGASQLFTAIDAATTPGQPDMDVIVPAILNNGVTLGTH